jgi:AbrB family looped-hinge helix DNA binding protein
MLANSCMLNPEGICCDLRTRSSEVEVEMTSSTKIQSRGQITLPKEVRLALDAKPGDTVIVRTVGPKTAELSVVRALSISELIAKYRGDESGEPYDDAAIREAWQAEAGDELIDRIRSGIE